MIKNALGFVYDSETDILSVAMPDNVHIPLPRGLLSNEDVREFVRGIVRCGDYTSILSNDGKPMTQEEALRELDKPIHS